MSRLVLFILVEGKPFFSPILHLIGGYTLLRLMGYEFLLVGTILGLGFVGGASSLSMGLGPRSLRCGLDSKLR